MGDSDDGTAEALQDVVDRVQAEPVAAADVTGATQGNVTVSATFSGDSATCEYSLDGQTWQAYTDGILVQENGSVFFRGTDAAGNVSEVTEYAVTKAGQLNQTVIFPEISADTVGQFIYFFLGKILTRLFRIRLNL